MEQAQFARVLVRPAQFARSSSPGSQSTRVPVRPESQIARGPVRPGPSSPESLFARCPGSPWAEARFARSPGSCGAQVALKS